MANSTKLYMRFGTTSGEKNFSYNYAKQSLSAATVKSIMNTFIANGEIFKYPPLTIIRAWMQVTEDTEFDLSE